MNEQMKARLERYRFGVDYYPEHWPRDRWEQDAALMEELGLQVVRMAEFSWQAMEPAEGHFTFQWLDDAIAVLARHGIETMLGTPTAAPPAWLIEKEPEILPVDSQGQRKSFGGRHHDCQSNPSYRKHVRRLVTAMAEHFRDNPHVVAWQIDNELGNSHYDLCMCDSCRSAFQQWLKVRYGTVESLNRAWGTAFWSQTYDSFAQIPAPRQTPTSHNPGLLLDWRRFCSDLVVDFQREQVRILRQICPHQPLTHNLMGFYDKTNYFDLAGDLDFASSDQYPTGFYFDEPQPDYEVAACMDLTRGFKQQNFWMLELQSGPTGGAVVGPTPRPGQLKLWTAQSVAHGADTIVYFRWRTCLFGTEQFWHGILPHDGVPGRRFQEIRETISLLKPVMDDTHGIVPQARVAILYDYDQAWALQIQPQHPELSYSRELLAYYEAFYRRNIPVDWVGPGADLSGYSLVIAPLQFVMTPERESALLHYTAQGGHLVLTMRTGVKDGHNACMGNAPLPGRLAEVVGARILDYDCQLWEKAHLAYGGLTGEARLWCDILTPTTAEVLATYTDSYFAGAAAVVKNRYEDGTAWYVGTALSKEMLHKFAGDLAQELGLTSVGASPEGVELTVRQGSRGEHLFLLNHTAQVQTVTLPAGWPGETVTLAPYDVKILERKG